MIYGVDIGGTKIEFVVFSDDLLPLERKRVDTPATDYKAFLDVIASFVEEADARFGERPPVGLGVPGLTDADGRALCANLPGVSGNRVGEDVGKRIGRPVATLNDTRCLALSEAVGGAGEGYRVVFGAILGTGAAGGLVVDGKVHDGHFGIAGEYGHLPIPATLQVKYALPIRKCGCGLDGCFETYIAGDGLKALARHFGFASGSTHKLAEAWQQDEPAAVKTRDAFLDLLGAAFANVSKLCDPEVIVMGGGLSLMPGVIERLPAAISAHLFSGFPAPKVVPARFGDASGVRGAAIIARNLEA